MSHAPARTRLMLVGAVAAIVVVLLPGGVAHADPTVAQIEAQIQAAWSEAEPPRDWVQFAIFALGMAAAGLLLFAVLQWV